MEQIRYFQMEELENNHWWFSSRRKIVGNVLKNLNIENDAQILDVGCGTGGNRSLLSQFGKVKGIELDDYALQIARMKKNGEIYKGSLPNQLNVGNEKFEVITLLDVLEHVEEDVLSLQRLSQLLKPNGYLIITVPAFPFLWSQHDEDHHHRRRYLYSSLQSCIEQTTLTIKHMTYYNFWLFPFIAGVRLMKKHIRHNVNIDDVELPNRAINALLETIFSSERYLVQQLKLPFGLSLLAVVKNEENLS
jgi:SAM-dependent methyltransferase